MVQSHCLIEVILKSENAGELSEASIQKDVVCHMVDQEYRPQTGVIRRGAP